MKYYVTCGEENQFGLKEIVQADTPTDAAVIALSRQNYDKSSLGPLLYVNERGFPQTRLEMCEDAFPGDGLFISLMFIWQLTFPESEV